MPNSMTGLERVLSVLARCERDCVPTFEWDIDSSVIARLTGVRPELYSAMVKAFRKYGRYPLDLDRLAS